MALSEPIRQQISGLLARERVVLFMKGSRQMPQCGFSAQVVQVLDELLPDYETVDVLRSPELREGIKEYTRWPTIPQLFIGGEFIGGCDIVREMSASGELQKLLGADASNVRVPKIDVTPAAVEAFRAALADAGDDREPRVIVELLDAKAAELAVVSGADDFVVSDALASLMMSQLSEHPDLAEVYRQIYSAGGSSLHMESAADFVGKGELTFGQVVATTAVHGRLAIGWRTEVDGEAGGATIRQTAIFDPVGLLGLLYWYTLYPLHQVVFAGMLRGIVKAVEEESPAPAGGGARE